MLTLFWPGLVKRLPPEAAKESALQQFLGSSGSFDDAQLRDLDFSGSPSQMTNLSTMSFTRSEMSELNFRYCTLINVDFSGGIFDTCDYANANLTNANFMNSLLIDCDLTGAELSGTRFEGLDGDSTALVKLPEGVVTLSGPNLLGFLGYSGARTDEVSRFYTFEWHPDFALILKVARNLIDVTWGQRRGIEQRGESRQNIPLARRFVQALIKDGLVVTRGNNTDMIGLTTSGRAVFSQLLNNSEIDPVIAKFLEAELN